MALINLSLIDGRPGELHSLFSWLQRTDELRGRVRTLPRQPGPHEMGGAVEMVSVALGSGGAGAVLVGALTTWLQTRRARISVEFVVDEAGETLRRVEVEASNAASVKELYDALASDRAAP
ncbi:effector-associated constant component EACC1 [Micromonospora sp. WMMD737]|uniref:effector-associated constant component EACC1 n=1 Tax=Micromonospora sp. WMMD737 TaxID=3404113 RepID=UPI003B923319